MTYFSLGSGATTAATSGVQYFAGFPSGTEVKVSLAKKGEHCISATLYLKFVKSKLGKVQVEAAKKRLKKLQNLIAYSKEMGQKALYEALCEEVAVLVREAEMVAYGVDTWVDLKDIDKFRGIVKDRVIRWDPLEKFPRVIPKKVQTKLKQLEKAKVFDEFHILYIDYTGQELKTTKEKIRNKDPILFGRFSHQPNRFYYIADWVDEYCDLTLDKFVEKFKESCPDYGVNKVEDITSDRWKSIVEEVKARHDRLENTKSDNWRELEKEEAKAETTKLKSESDTPAPKGKSFKEWLKLGRKTKSRK